jgi:hypothetical protein
LRRGRQRWLEIGIEPEPVRDITQLDDLFTN